LLPAARRDLNRLPRNVQPRIVAALRELETNPRPPGVVKLTGEDNTWRIRVGVYRVLYEIHDQQLLVLALRIAQRRDAYRK